MMRLIFAMILLVSVPSFASNAKEALKPLKVQAKTLNDTAIKFDFQFVSISQIVSLIYLEALKQPYVIDPALLMDERLVSFRFDASKGDLRVFWNNFLDSLNLKIETRDGVDYLSIKKIAEAEAAESDVYIYKPKYRQVSYLTGLLTPLFTSGSFTVNRVVRAPANAKTNPMNVQPGTASAAIDQDSDTLIFAGSGNEIQKLKKILPQVDTNAGEVVVKMVVYEVTTAKTEGTAFGLALNVLGGRLGLSLGNANSLANSIAIKSANIDAALSALAGDSRFRTMSTPTLRVKSGAHARLAVGQDVPTLGAVSFPQGGGQPVQSIEYKSSGVILDLSPIVRESTIDMTIDQQISDFAKTETGVNNSPTLTKRQLSTSVSLADGELVLIGGLTQEKNSDAHSGLPFLPKFLHSKSNDDSRTEILLMLQITKIGSSQ
ncbi:type II secretion system protein GspD [Undibacterium danionis]|uniref:Type II secretion system protein GspD n=1 Tax=Undibacterium danionis TaxID=1812100 RepID=A0ABV6IC51_9BURK